MRHVSEQAGTMPLWREKGAGLRDALDKAVKVLWGESLVDADGLACRDHLVVLELVGVWVVP
jgi:hypothetical protein